MTSPLSLALSSISDGLIDLRVGVVYSVTSSQVLLTVGGVRVAMTSRLASYTPTVGHVVLLAVTGSGGYVVLGRLVNP